jgi:UDP-N-acetylmuramoyl-tripeptide--D-alanyl-D-alanine ligase
MTADHGPKVMPDHAPGPLMTLAQANALLPGSLLVGDGAIAIRRVHSDSRSTQAGDLFVALRGDRFDGHDHVQAAIAAGAVAVLADHGLSAAGDIALPGLQVGDSLLALQQLATGWRALWARTEHGPLIAVTGSNGKTTVTQMVAAMLRAWIGDAALATAGNLNNHIGVPLTLLRLRVRPGHGAADEAGRPHPHANPHVHRAAVLELGMNHPGEIALLSRIAAPTIALVNNAQREHQEFMDGVEAVARENGSVIPALPEDGTLVIPSDDAYTPLWRTLAGSRRVIDFGGRGAAVTADASWSAGDAAWTLQLRTPQGQATTTLQQAGQHNVRNALAATACALAAGAPLQAAVQGLATFRPVAGRSQTLRIRLRDQDLTLVDDSYNANPDSVIAAIDVLATLPGPHWLLLGDMAEVGTRGPQFHAEVGLHARQRGIDTVWTAGSLSAHAGPDRHFGSVAEMLQALHHDTLPPAGSLLVKGSRSIRMEQVVRALQALSAAAGGAR